jgi:hypothetical protein
VYEHKINFVASQASPTLVLSHPDLEPISAGNRIGWSMGSYEYTDDTRLDALTPDGGRWVGTVETLPDEIFNMTATYFTDEKCRDSVQFTGPLFLNKEESSVAIVGGTGKYAGNAGLDSARYAGQRICAKRLDQHH